MPLSLTDGGFIKSGYSAELDKWRSLAQNSTELIASLQAKYVASTHNSRLKVKWSDSLGYFIEVPSSSPVSDASFLTCQILKGHVRYKTSELSELDQMRYRATEQVRKLEVGERWSVKGRTVCSTR